MIHRFLVCPTKKKRMAGAGLLAAAAAVALVVCSSASAAGDGGQTRRRRAALLPAVYVFGDSLVDVGNNDFLPPPAPRAGFPCGVDLPRGTSGRRTGRFTNGYNLADFVAQRVGFDLSPPAYLSLTPQVSLDLLSGRVGANYASGGSGILDATGNGTITLREQFKLFTNTKANMNKTELGHNRVNRLLSRSLFLISTAGNDFSTFSHGSGTMSAHIANMVSTYLKHIKVLYNLGTRRLGLLDALPHGCLPNSRVSLENDGACNDAYNSLARQFNALLRLEMASATAATMPGWSTPLPASIISSPTLSPTLLWMDWRRFRARAAEEGGSTRRSAARQPRISAPTAASMCSGTTFTRRRLPTSEPWQPCSTARRARSPSASSSWSPGNR